MDTKVEKIKIGIIGNGWRSMTYVKIIKELGNIFSLEGMLFRSTDKAAEYQKKYGIKAFDHKDEFLAQEFDFVLLALPRSVVPDWCEELFSRNIPVLCETPPGDGVENLINMWSLKEKYSAKIQVAEQYFFQPHHCAVINTVKSGLIGDVTDCTVSSMHDYHGISVMRRLLGIGFEPCWVTASSFHLPVTLTCGRDGDGTNGEIVTDSRKKAKFSFDNGKLGFYDFSDEQYFNLIRSRHMSVRGIRGEIFDDTVAFINHEGTVITEKMNRVDGGQRGNLEGFFHKGITLCGKYIYQNPFAELRQARLTDDEIAMAELLVGMDKFVKTGEEVYPLKEALQDTYLGLLMDESIETETTVRTKPMPWQN